MNIAKTYECFIIIKPVSLNQCCRYFQEKIAERPGFRLVMPEFQCSSICFWYIPESLRDQNESDEWWLKVNTVSMTETGYL